MHLKLICCEAFHREVAAAVSRSLNQIDVEFLPHSLSQFDCAAVRQRLARTLEAVDEARYHAVLLDHACDREGLVGLKACSIPLVVPRRENCVVRPSPAAHSLADFWGAGYSESLGAPKDSFLAPSGCSSECSEAMAALGVEPAEWTAWQAEQEAAWFGWDFERAPAWLRRLQRLVDGYWSYEEFLVVRPGWEVAAGHNDNCLIAHEVKA